MNKFNPFRFSISTLLLLTVIAALAVSHYPKQSEKIYLQESLLDKTETAILKQLRSDGLNIEQIHVCGMGDLASFTVSEIAKDRYHVTEVYVKDTNAADFIDKILEFPELNLIQISNRRTLTLTIDCYAIPNTEKLKETVKGFMNLEPTPADEIAALLSDLGTKVEQETPEGR